MYHCCDSIDRDLFLTELQWHRLDNIGALMCFTNLFTFLMDNRNRDIDISINLAEFLMHLILQEKDPWNVMFTIIPILLSSLKPLVKMVILKKFLPYRAVPFTLGIVALFVGFAFFFLALDDDHDFLRIYHGMWHMSVGSASYFLWNCLPDGKGHDSGNLQSFKLSKVI